MFFAATLTIILSLTALTVNKMKQIDITINYKSKNLVESEEFAYTEVSADATRIISAIAEKAIAELDSQDIPVENLSEVSITLTQKGIRSKQFTSHIQLKAKCVCVASTKSESHG